MLTLKDASMSSTIRFRAQLGRQMAAGLTLAALSACSVNDILTVDRPDIVDPGKISGPAAATSYYNGALGDVALAQGTFSGLMLISSLFSDEFRFGGTPPEVREFDLGDVRIANSFATVPYLNLHRARRAAENAAVQVAANASPTDKRVGELYALAAMTAIWIGETYCSGAPFSAANGDDIEYGSATSTNQIMDIALARLQSGSTATGGDARITGLIAVLRGRALLNKGDAAAAATAVAAVPTSYVYQTPFSSADDRTKNNMKAFIFDFDYLSVSDREGTNGLDYASSNDPRIGAIPTTAPGGVSRFDGKTPFFIFPKYNSFDSPIVNASGIEARMIEAEAALKVNNLTLWLTKLNDARHTRTDLPDLTDPGNDVARVNLTFRERAFWMYGTAHRLGDMRRLVRQYNRAVTSVFPTGPYHKDGLTRGNEANVLVPTSEKNNPNWKDTDCNNRAA